MQDFQQNIDYVNTDISDSYEELEAALYVIATPIGNLQDISLRALSILRNVKIIYCEDTRTTNKLCKAFAINATLRRFDDHTEQKLHAKDGFKEIIEAIKTGEAIALVSDAGTPLVCDPGFRLVETIAKANLPVVAIPGASALLVALTSSGFPAYPFKFMGFPPRKKNEIDIWVKYLSTDDTVVFFERLSRIPEILKALENIEPTRQCIIGRELTKKFEDIKRGTVQEIMQNFPDITMKGEATVVLSAMKNNQSKLEHDAQYDLITLDRLLTKAMQIDSVKDASRWAAETLSYSKNYCYQRALQLKENGNKK